LKFFLANPTTSIHIKELARKLKISSMTANVYLGNYGKENILIKKKVGNLSLYSLNNDETLVKELKKCYALSFLKEKKLVKNALKENPMITSIILYGTYASGDYDEKSDVDLLFFSRDKRIPKKAISVLGKETTVNALTLNEWRKLNKGFRDSVIKSHIILYGTGLVG